MTDNLPALIRPAVPGTVMEPARQRNVTSVMRILSLGAGVQSTTLALLAAEGTLPGLQAAVFADTGGEPQYVYDHLDRLEAVLAEVDIPVFRVGKGNLREDIVKADGRHYSAIPWHVRKANGQDAVGVRQCTRDYKVRPINRKVRELLGAKPPKFRSVPRGRVCEQWVGFSSDEVFRVNDKEANLYIRRRYPLIELHMDRRACQRYLEKRGFGNVAKSACIFCPFHGNRYWREMKANRPDEWESACEFDEQIRSGARVRQGVQLDGEAYLHASRIPLRIAPLHRDSRKELREDQLDIFDVLEEGEPDGCSPYGCRSGAPV